MSSLACECPRCGEACHVPTESLLVAITTRSAGTGGLAFVCNSCNQFVDAALSLRQLSILLAAGCTALVVTLAGERE